MKKNKVQDERIINAKRKIQSDGFQIVWLVLIISVLIQQYLYKAEFIQYAVEFFILIAMSVYLICANLGVGNDLFDSSRSKYTLIINSLVTGIIVTIINTTVNVMNYGDKVKGPLIGHIALVAGITFISITALSYVVLKGVYFINKKKQQALDKKLKDEDSIE